MDLGEEIEVEEVEPFITVPEEWPEEAPVEPVVEPVREPEKVPA